MSVIQGVIALLGLYVQFLGKIRTDSFRLWIAIWGRSMRHFTRTSIQSSTKSKRMGCTWRSCPTGIKMPETGFSVNGIPEKLQAYCKFLAKRYAKRNIFWVLGRRFNGGGIDGAGNSKAYQRS